jgi:hypothetical protein
VEPSLTVDRRPLARTVYRCLSPQNLFKAAYQQVRHLVDVPSGGTVTGTSPASEVVGDTPLGALRAADTYDSLLSRMRSDYAVILAMPLHHLRHLMWRYRRARYQVLLYQRNQTRGQNDSKDTHV